MNDNIGSPMIVTKDGQIVDGHTRYRIAKRLGIKFVPIVRLESSIEQEDINNLRETY